MKLLIILLLITTTITAQDSWTSNDKLTHLNTSMTLTFASGQLIEGVTGWKYSNEVAAMTVLSAGIAKEFILDQTVSHKDIVFNVVGTTVGYYINRFINKKIRNSQHQIRSKLNI